MYLFYFVSTTKDQVIFTSICPRPFLSLRPALSLFCLIQSPSSLTIFFYFLSSFFYFVFIKNGSLSICVLLHYFVQVLRSWHSRSFTWIRQNCLCCWFSQESNLIVLCFIFLSVIHYDYGQISQTAVFVKRRHTNSKIFWLQIMFDHF